MFQTTKEANRLLLEGQIALAEVEASGVRVDKRYLENTIVKTDITSRKLRKKMEESKMARDWRKVYGDLANLDSREQLGEMLFKHYELKSDKKTASGKRESTEKSVLEKIEIPFIQDMLKIGELKKTKDYLNGIHREMVQHSDGNWYIHPAYSLNLADTFRSSCRNPNWQNQPVRNDEMAATVRRCYIPRPGRQIAEPDLSQIEVRVASCYNLDPALIDYIEDPRTDMHRDMAIELFFLRGIDVDWKSKDSKAVRHTAKNQFVFPEFYGSVHFQIAPAIWDTIHRRNLSVTDKSGKKHLIKDILKQHKIAQLGTCQPRIDPTLGTFEHYVWLVQKKFWKKFQVYDNWKKSWFADCQANRGFMSKVGFAFNGPHKRNDFINYPIQCDAFMCLLWSLIQTVKWFRKYKFKSLVIGEIHDSMQLDIDPRERDDVLSGVHEIMVEKVRKHWDWIIVPLESETDVCEIDQSWYAKRLYVPDANGVWGVKA